MTLTMDKAGIMLGIIASFPDGMKLERVCDCPQCRKVGRQQRYRLLPCGCHGAFVASTPYRVKEERFVDVYEIEDPHGNNAKLRG